MHAPGQQGRTDTATVFPLSRSSPRILSIGSFFGARGPPTGETPTPTRPRRSRSPWPHGSSVRRPRPAAAPGERRRQVDRETRRSAPREHVSPRAVELTPGSPRRGCPAEPVLEPTRTTSRTRRSTPPPPRRRRCMRGSARREPPRETSRRENGTRSSREPARSCTVVLDKRRVVWNPPPRPCSPPGDRTGRQGGHDSSIVDAGPCRRGRVNPGER